MKERWQGWCEDKRRGKVSDVFRRIYERVFTCSMVSVPLVPPLTQYFVRCSEKYSYVNLIDYALCGTSGHGRLAVFKKCPYLTPIKKEAIEQHPNNVHSLFFPFLSGPPKLFCPPFNDGGVNGDFFLLVQVVMRIMVRRYLSAGGADFVQEGNHPVPLYASCRRVPVLDSMHRVYRDEFLWLLNSNSN